MMQPKGLAYIQQVARSGSIRKAASICRIAPSAINRQISNIEDELGGRIFERRPDGITVTPLGDIVLDYIEKSMADYHDLLNNIENIKGGDNYNIKIYTLDSLMVSIIPKTIREITREMPEVTFSVVAGRPSEIPQKLQKGVADIAITFTFPQDPIVVTHSIFPAPIGAVVAAGHPLASRDVVSLRDMLAYPLLVPLEPLPQPSAANMDYIAFRQSAHALCRSNEIGFTRKLILEGTGIGCYTKIGYMDEIEKQNILWVPTDNKFLNNINIGVFSLISSPISPLINKICVSLCNNIQENIG